MKSRKKSNSTSSPPPTVAARRASRVGGTGPARAQTPVSAAAVAHSSPHIPGLLLDQVPLEDFEALCRDAITPSYAQPDPSALSHSSLRQAHTARFSVHHNAAIASAPGATLGQGSTGRPPSPVSALPAHVSAALPAPAHASPAGPARPPHTAIPMDSATEERTNVAESFTAQAHQIINEMKFVEDSRNEFREAKVEAKFQQAGIDPNAALAPALNKSSSQDSCVAQTREGGAVGLAGEVGEGSGPRPHSLPPHSLAQVPQTLAVDSPPDFGLYLSRTENVPELVKSLKHHNILSSDCKETLVGPRQGSLAPAAADEIPFIDEGSDDSPHSSPPGKTAAVRPHGRLPDRLPHSSPANPIRLQDSAIVDSGPPANVEVELKALNEGARDDVPRVTGENWAAQHAHNPARVDPANQMRLSAGFPFIGGGNFFQLAPHDAGFFRIRSEEEERRAMGLGPPQQTQPPKRRAAAKERRERMAKKNVREAMMAEEMEGHRGNEAVESLLSFIEGPGDQPQGLPKRHKKAVKAASESGAATATAKAQASRKKKAGCKTSVTSPASSAALSLDSESEEEDASPALASHTATRTPAQALANSPPKKLLDTSDMRLFASDSVVQQLLLSTASEPSAAALSEDQEFKVVETKKKVKKVAGSAGAVVAARPPPFPRSSSSAVASRPHKASAASSPPPASAPPLSPSALPAKHSAQSPPSLPADSEEWPVMPKRRQSADQVPQKPSPETAEETAQPQGSTGISWASVASKPHHHTSSLHTSRSSSPGRHSASATNAANASSPALHLISPSEPLELSPAGKANSESLSLAASALVSPPLPPHPEDSETKSWANVAAASRPTAVVKPQPVLPPAQEALKEEDDSLAAAAEGATGAETGAQTPPPDEPTQRPSGGAETGLGPGEVEFAFPTSDSATSDASDDDVRRPSGISFGDFRPLSPPPHDTAVQASGLSFGDFGSHVAELVRGGGAVEVLEEEVGAGWVREEVPVAQTTRSSAKAAGRKEEGRGATGARAAESDVARQMRKEFESSIQSAGVKVFRSGQILQRS